MYRRPAVTLTEVLIAIFIMGIGMLSLLTLFPLGAVNMAQAIKDDRTAHLAANATAMARIIWKQACEADPPANSPKFWDSTNNVPRHPQRWVMAMDNPRFNDKTLNPPLDNQDASRPYDLFPTNSGPPPEDAAPHGPFVDMTPIPVTGWSAMRTSYPVFVDPIGWQAYDQAGNDVRKWWLPTLSQRIKGGKKANRFGAIPRRPLYVKDPVLPSGPHVLLGRGSPSPVMGATQRLLNQFVLQDDLTFAPDGTPAKNASGQLERQGRYSYAYLFRRKRNDDGNRSRVEVTVVVYAGRSPDVPTPETAYLATLIETDSAGNPITAVPDKRRLTISHAGKGKPALRRGSWILDATLFKESPSASDPTGHIDPQGYFYRVVNVDDANSAVDQTVSVELQTELAGNPNTIRVIVVLENVVEVFPKGEFSETTPPSWN